MSDDFEKMMSELREDYIKSIPLKIMDIELHLAAKMWPELRNDFHKLKGTGKTYGIPEISTLCDPVEKICVNKPEAVLAVIPSALFLLKEIYSQRLANKEYALENNPAFVQIRNIAAPFA